MSLWTQVLKWVSRKALLLAAKELAEQLKPEPEAKPEPKIIHRGSSHVQ